MLKQPSARSLTHIHREGESKGDALPKFIARNMQILHMKSSSLQNVQGIHLKIKTNPIMLFDVVKV